jgi:hypothetical protein
MLEEKGGAEMDPKTRNRKRKVRANMELPDAFIREMQGITKKSKNAGARAVFAAKLIMRSQWKSPGVRHDVYNCFYAMITQLGSEDSKLFNKTDRGHIKAAYAALRASLQESVSAMPRTQGNFFDDKTTTIQ